MINVRGLQRNVKNVVKNYTEAQVKVREATSNDPWGPPSTLMAEIADLTHNVVAFSEIMQMIWKRLNDHGKNWRHVYKALSLLDYLIKTGSEKVAQQCKDNIYAIKTLYCFQYIEENKDQGVNVREKSKALVALLSDDEKLRIERERALKAKERFAQSISYMSSSGSGENVVAGSSDPAFKTSRSDTASSGSSAANPDLEKARPQTLGEEELHLRLALAMSKEEAEVEERQRKNDDLRLQLALTESEKEKAKKKASAMDDLLSIELSQPVAEIQSTSQLDVWGTPIAAPTASGSSNLNGLELLGAVGPSTTAINNTDDFFSALDSQNNQPSTSQFVSDSDSIWPALSNVKDLQVSNEPLLAQNDPWQPVSSTSATPEPTKVATNDPWSSVPTSKPTTPLSNGTTANRKTPESFLGANFNLVNLDSLITSKTTNNSSLPLGGNPFAAAVTSNPFQAAKPAPLTINQLRSQTSLFPDTKNNGSIAPSASNASNAFAHNSHDFSLNLNASKNPFAI